MHFNKINIYNINIHFVLKRNVTIHHFVSHEFVHDAVLAM